MPAGLEELRFRLAEISDLGRARSLLSWDERTQMPPAGAEQLVIRRKQPTWIDSVVASPL